MTARPSWVSESNWQEYVTSVEEDAAEARAEVARLQDALASMTRVYHELKTGEVARLRAALTEIAELDCGTTWAPWRTKARTALGEVVDTPQPRADLSETIVDRIARDAIETAKRAVGRAADPETP